MIDLEFGGSGWRGQTAKEKEVVNRWRIYADHLNEPLEDRSEARVDVWFAKGDELFTDLLVALAAALGYSFDRVQLKRGIYRPRAHGEAENRQQAIERALVGVLTGETPLSMRVTEVPVSAEAADLQKKLLDAYTQDGALKVKQVA
jgi:hypothetical protein